MSELEELVAALAADHCAMFYPARGWDDLYCAEMLKILNEPGLLADCYAAANNYQGVAVGPMSEWQQSLWQGLRGVYLQKSRQHPLQTQKAEAFASTGVRPFTLAREVEIVRRLDAVGPVRRDQH
jgi:hypothetical protein